MYHLNRTYTYGIVLLGCILLSTHAFAQPQSRGFGDLAPAPAIAGGRTVALVVGVSDYPYVAPLNYAAEDALLMNDFLQSKAGGSVEPANIRLLLNEEATLQNVVILGISWLENTIKPTKGDRVIIYLAGHGDAVDASEAYFLCYNVNPAGDKNNYQVTGALDIGKLKSRISKFAAAGAEVILIMDACRSGDLPGVRTGITNPFESVLERKAGETLMLSASANQLAVEDRRWGRGHGAFTWNLIQGLSGKADENVDGSVDFYEIEQYTKAKVRKETQAMGRMQVPQFAAAPSGGGVLGRTDNTFLNKLSTESLSAVSISESIAQARTAAESSLFTDSMLYAGFNQIKKLVRQNKYLGEGSAEPVYARLVEQFPADQIEPVRLYYMSALASAGFEAMNRELFCPIGISPDIIYYKRRFSYLTKASQLRLNQGEVYQLDDHLKIVEAITQLYGGKRVLSQGMVDSVSSMHERLGRSAAYYAWLAVFGIDHISSKQISDEKLISPIVSGLLDSCLKLAPDWPRVTYLRMRFKMTSEEFDEELGDRINNLIASDGMNDEHLFLSTLFYMRHKPYDLIRLQNTVFKRAQLTANPQAISDMLAHILSIEGIETELDMAQWLKAEAYTNYYHYDLPEDVFPTLIDIVSRTLDFPIDEEFVRPNFQIIIRGLIRYASIKSKLSDITDILLKLLVQAKQIAASDDLAVISSLIENKTGYETQSRMVDSLLYYDMRTYPSYFGTSAFSDTVARFIAYRIYCTRGIEELKSYRANQIRLLSQFSYPGFKDEFLIFRAKNYIAYGDVEVQDSFADSLLELCHRSPSQEKYRLYWDLIEKRGWVVRQAELYADSAFLHACDTLFKEKSERVFLRDVEATYYCYVNDTLRLKRLFRTMQGEGDEGAIAKVALKLDTSWQNVISTYMLKSDTVEIDFIDLVDLGLLDRAEVFFNKHGHEWELNDKLFWKVHAERVKNLMAAIKLFNLKGDFARSALILEKLLDRFQLGIFITPAKYRSFLGPYDAFIQSKEYKAMMARVYTAPDKR